MEMASSRSSKKHQTRTQKMQRKKRMEELLKSAYSSYKNHLSDSPLYNNSNALSLFLESGRGDKLSSNLKEYIQKLLKINMEGPYGAEWPEEEKVKRREMSSPEALYIFVYKGPSTPSKAEAPIIGFVHYRFTIEEEIPVLYVYELQLEEAYQGMAVGKFLMQLVELIACKLGVIGEDKSYEILCKTFDHEAKAVLEEE
uniref:N-alpha-acetyltransferase 40 isoform X2 n=1 Tax=Erigeron canadensis TaxID=72917 RepID=UPI001CB8A9B8|nr:N-alpha-acetyltransferase 40 isoform X2 [Erigeron canadensis]